jgi:HEAT repeat protein
MIVLCPSCWATVTVEAAHCAQCGEDLQVLDQRQYSEKLRGALDHPDRETVMRVAKVLGDRRERESAGALVTALRSHWQEPYVAAAIVSALGHLDAEQAGEAVHEALGHESFIVRKEAALALQQGRPDVARKGR